MLAWGLNITVGFAGLLDLGYVGFYAIGAYSYALLAQALGIGFWTALPLAGLIAAVTGFLLGFPVLRLRGDYFAIVTLGFGEIVRLVLINWTTLTNGPNGISGVPRPTLFGITFEPAQRVIFLYYIGLALALLWGFLACGCGVCHWAAPGKRSARMKLRQPRSASTARASSWRSIV